MVRLRQHSGRVRRPKSQVDALATSLGRDPATLDATAAVFVQLEGGGGRQMGNYGAGDTIVPVAGSPTEIADQLSGFADAGAAHIQLVVDPITRDSIEWLEEAFRSCQAAEHGGSRRGVRPPQPFGSHAVDVQPAASVAAETTALGQYPRRRALFPVGSELHDAVGVQLDDRRQCQ